jgi:hypothetical protein
MSPTKATKKPSSAGGASLDKKAGGDKKASPDKKAVAEKKADPDKKLVARTGIGEPVKPGAPREAVKSTPPIEPKPAAAKPISTPAPPRELGSEPPADGGEGKDAKREKAPSAVQTLANELIAAGDPQAVLRHAGALEDERETTANHAARLMQELAELKPELLVPLIERFARLVAAKNRRVIATSAAALAPLSRIAPAKVAKQLPLLTQNWELTTEEGKDGLVRTFAGLCTASVAYQKRLEPALARALGEAEPKLLIRWTEIVLPALKGEPHARARAVVEERLPNIPRPQAQKIADFLGIKLRPLPR